MKKTGLGKDPLSWIRPTQAPEPVDAPAKAPEPKSPPAPAPRRPAARVPKFQTFEVRLTTLLRDDQLDFLDKMVRDIRKNRTAEYRKERVTKNTVIRALIDAVMYARPDTRNIADEEALLQRFLEVIRR